MQRYRAISRRARRGFTLMELMVSVAILLAVLALIGTIFSTTSKAGGKATAITVVHRQLRQAAEIIRQDLEAMDPTTDVLGAAGVVVQARDNRKADSVYPGHRADILMLITTRRDTRPSAFTVYADPNTDLGDKMQVVYGHADTAMFASTGLPITVKHIENTPSDIPAYDWHLARRTILFPTAPKAATINSSVDGVEDLPLTMPEFMLGNSDLTSVPLVATLFPSGVFTYFGGVLGQCYLDKFTLAGSDLCSYQYRANRKTPPSPWLLFDTADNRWYQPGSGANDWTRTIAPSTTRTINPVLPPPSLTNNYTLDLQFYSGLPSGWVYRRTVIDSSPLLNDSRRVGPHFLPNCSDFRVEFSYDDPRDVDDYHQWPGTVGDPLVVVGGGPGPSTFTRPIHWHSLDDGTQWVWSKISPRPADRTQTDRWPTAIRITLRAWDAGGRLDEPVTYTLIHTF